uniref:Tim44-like domain-containing protein n=1 Tax=Globisporangium ultimum (strain ATCC 200006 / CBS 805.95 / DAOM BR144) TaxID=431595 RepID=K3XAG0_GLOUD
MLRHTARVALRNGKLTRVHRSPARLQAHVQSQRRAMGFFSDLKNQFKNELEKNEELKKSLDEFQKTKEQLKEVEKAAKEKYQEVSSKTEEAAKSFQEQATNASQKLKETLEENVKAASGAEKSDDKKDNSSDTTSESESASASGESSSEKAEATEATDSPLDGARAFVKNIFAGLTAQRNKIIKPNALPKWRDEWKDAARELFGTKEKRSVDDALSSVKTPTYSKPASTESTDEAPEYTGSSALVAVKEDETAWQRVSARFREAPIIQGILDAAKQAARTEAGRKVGEKAKLAKDKIGDAREDVLEFWETSQNPWVYRMSSIYDGLFGETPMAVAIKQVILMEIRRAEPDFILEEWKENIEEIVLPGVLEAFLRGNSRDLKKWFGEAAYSRINIAIRERKTEGLVMDPNVLSIDNVDVIEATAEDKQAPIILLRFQAQQINCIRNREGEVVDGAEDEVLAYYYIFAFQRDYDEEQEALRWRIVDIHMQRGGRYY